MTEKLKTLMHEQADVQDFAVPDVDALVAAGDRRRRTRRLGVVAGVAAASVGAVLVVPALLGPGHGPGPTGTTATEAAPLTWIVGSVLHEGAGSETDLGVEVRSYVRTDTGYLLAEADGTVWSWVGGELTEVGTTGKDLRLVSDDESSLAGWLDTERGYVVLDQATGEVTEHGSGPGPFSALDDGRALWVGDGGPVVVDLSSGEQSPVEGGVNSYLGDLEDDRVAASGDQGITFWTVGGDLVRELPNGYSDTGSFSPDGRFYTYDADEPQVYDVASGDRVSLDVGGRQFATGYEWLGSGSLAVLAAGKADDRATAELLVCQVPDGSCEPVAELGTFDALEKTLALPVGMPVTG